MHLSHPSLVVHPKRLFNTVLKHGYVSDNFGISIIVSLVKDRHGNTHSYRPITVSAGMMISIALITTDPSLLVQLFLKKLKFALHDKLQPFLHVSHNYRTPSAKWQNVGKCGPIFIHFSLLNS